MTGKAVDKGKGPKVFDYDDYRKFLSDFYSYLKHRTLQGFSYRQYSNLTGFRSPVSLKRIIDGERNLSPQSADRLSRNLSLKKREREYFINLIHFNQSQCVSEKKHFLKQLLRCMPRRTTFSIDKEDFEYFEHWYYSAIREMIGIRGFQQDPVWISKTLRPKISPDQAKRAIKVLLKLKMIKYGPDDHLEQCQELLSTGDQVRSSLAAELHRVFIQKGGESIERFNREEREIHGVTLSVTDAQAEQIKLLIRECYRSVMQISAGGEKGDRVYQFNMQMFPWMTDLSKKKGGRR